jgi:hypothetical protein
VRGVRHWIEGPVLFLAAVALFSWMFAKAYSRASGEAKETPIVEPTRAISHTANGNTVIQISRVEQARIGLVTEALQPLSLPVELTAYGTVMDPAPLMALNSQLESARATLAASRSQFDRAKLLHAEGQNVSLKDVQTAEAKFRADNAQFELLTQQLGDNWGEPINSMSPSARGSLVAALVRRAEGILRVSLPPSESLSEKPESARVSVLGYETHPLTAKWIALDPTINPQLQGQGFLLRVAAEGFPLRPGAAVTANLEAPEHLRYGFLVPDAAVVRTGDGAYIYAEVASTAFERRRVSLTERKENGWFVSTGLDAGERAVVTGAQDLLSRELQSQIQIED